MSQPLKLRSGRAPCRRVVWRIGLLVTLALTLGACAVTRPDAGLPWANARQLVLVVTPDWNAHAGSLHRYERTHGDWQPAGVAVPVVIGRAGAAWGVGLHPPQPGARKREGDGRSPAGVFAIGTAFGYADTAATRLAYAALHEDDYCVDVSDSPLYNRIVAARDVGADAVARSTEPMRRDLHLEGDQAYKLGFVIEHNAAGLPGAGSCIFVHLWKSPATPTSGCTALAEPALDALLGWLQPDAHPIFVLLPRGEYERLRSAWQLPTDG